MLLYTVVQLQLEGAVKEHRYCENYVLKYFQIFRIYIHQHVNLLQYVYCV